MNEPNSWKVSSAERRWKECSCWSSLTELSDSSLSSNRTVDESRKKKVERRMSRPLPPRLNKKEISVPSGNSNSGLITPVTTLDPIHRQKIQQLRLQAANASRKRQGFRSKSFSRKDRSLFFLSLIIRVFFFCFFLSLEENLHRHFFWLIRTLLWLSAIFSLTVLVIAFPLAVDPAMESLWRRFSSKALICLTTDIQIHHSRMPDGSVKGDDACTWTSCRNGCTGKYLN